LPEDCSEYPLKCRYIKYHEMGRNRGDQTEEEKKGCPNGFILSIDSFSRAGVPRLKNWKKTMVVTATVLAVPVNPLIWMAKYN